MTFNVEVLLKGKEHIVETVVDFDGPEPAAWADDDVRRVLELTLGAFDQVQNPGAEERSVALRGFSWIVTPVDGGVAIAIEIPSGAVVAGTVRRRCRHADRHHHPRARQRAGQRAGALITPAPARLSGTPDAARAGPVSCRATAGVGPYLPPTTTLPL